MLKDKYRFKFTLTEATELMLELERMFIHYGNTKDLELKLPIAVLMDFQKRLAGALLFPQDKVKLHF